MQQELEEAQEKADIAETQANKLRTKSREFGKVHFLKISFDFILKYLCHFSFADSNKYKR